MEKNETGSQPADLNTDKDAIYNWLKADEKVQLYLSKFATSSAENFMKSYAASKPHFMKDGDAIAAIADKRDEAGVVAAQLLLLQIQQKKLFDIFCVWNAEQMTHDDFKCSWDFVLAEGRIADCKLLSPISQEEFDLYLEYANSEHFDYEEHISLPALFLCLKPTEDKTIDIAEFPSWYQYESLSTGNSKYLFLDNIRLVKERRYFEIHQKNYMEEIERKYASGELERPVKDTRPTIESLNYNHTVSFIKACENRDVLGKFTNYYDSKTKYLGHDDEEGNNNAWLEENAETAFYELENLKELVPIAANADWRQALIDAHENYKRKQILDALPYVYSDYCMRIANNLALGWQEAEGWNQDHLAMQMKTNILKGRVINGEPEDFNF